MAKQKLPDDPRDYYVHNDVSLDELAKLYHGRKGCSLANLKNRSSKEKWVKQLDQNYTETRLKTDEILIESNASTIAKQLLKVGSIFDKMLQNIDNDLSFMGATVQDGEGHANKYHLESWKQGLASYLKPQEEKPDPNGNDSGFVGLPGINADSL